MAYGSVLGQSQSVLSPATAIKMGLEPTASADDAFDKLTGSVLFKANTTVIKTEQTTFQPTSEAFPGIACFSEPTWDGKNNKYIPADNKIQACKQINRNASDDPTLPTDTWGYWGYRHKADFYKYYIPNNLPTSYLYCEEGSNSYSNNTYIMGTTFKITAIEFGDSSKDGHLTNIQGAPIQIPSSQILNGVRMATGSYVGTGTYGEDQPSNKINLGFDAKFVYITGGDINNYGQYSEFAGIFPTGILPESFPKQSVGNGYFYFRDNNAPRSENKAKFSNGVLNWYSGSAEAQLNILNYKYFYIAIG